MANWKRKLRHLLMRTTLRLLGVELGFLSQHHVAHRKRGLERAPKQECASWTLCLHSFQLTKGGLLAATLHRCRRDRIVGSLRASRCCGHQRLISRRLHQRLRLPVKFVELAQRPLRRQMCVLVTTVLLLLDSTLSYQYHRVSAPALGDSPIQHSRIGNGLWRKHQGRFDQPSPNGKSPAAVLSC